eukprot:403373167
MKQISQQLQNLQPTSLNSTIVKPQTAKPTQMTELSQKFKEIQFQNSGSLTTDNVNVREYNSSIISNKNSENLMKLICNKTAGKQFEKNDPRVLQVQESQFYKRNYEQSEEIVRDIHYRNLVKKDHNYYRAVEDNLWNVPTRLSPKYCQYSKYSDVYKKSPRNLDKILAKQIDEETQENLKKVQRQKSQSHARYFKRKIERDIVSKQLLLMYNAQIEYKSQQRQKKEIQKEVEIFESQEPEIFDELAMKMRWTHVQKDPTKGLKDLQTFRLDSLNLVNHLPQEKVDKIVTSKVLKFDQDSCKMILENILKEQQTKDFKMNSQKIDREQLRKRLKTSHNKTLDIEEKCGLSQSFNSDVKRKPYQNLNQYSNSIMTGVRDLRSNTEQILNLENPEKEQFTQTQNLDGTVSMKLKYVQPKKYIRSDHTEALSIYKPEFNSKDFFAKSDFRGLILADHQEAIGPKAFKCVEELNDQVLSKFKTLFTENKDQTQKSFQQKADKSLNKTSGDISFGQVTSRSQEKHVAFTPKPQIKHIDESRVIEMEQQRLFTFQKQNDSVKNEQQALISVRGRERSVVDKQFSFNQKRSQTSFNQRRNIANIINGGGQVNYVMKENQIAQQNQNSFFLTDNQPMTHTVEGFAHISPLTSMKPRSISTHHQKTRINNTQKFSSVHEFFESPLSQIERFDQKFSKTGVRQFKYPNIELIAELFGDEVSDIKQRVKSEEEIKKYSTGEDMGELKRSIFLLKKGYQTQKISIIDNLNRLMREQGANEELLPIILSSMEIWDDSMQIECALSFCREDVIKYMNSQNQQKLLDECLNIIINADINNEDFIYKWVNVFKRLINYIPIETIRQQVVKRIIDLPSLKQQYPWRKIGFELFCAIIDAKGEEILKVEPNIFRVFTGMCTDTNWKIRKQAAQFLFEYLQPLHAMKKKSRIEEVTKRGDNSPQKNQGKFIQQNNEQAEVIKVTKTRFKSHFHDIIIELAADEEKLVQIDGIELMSEFLIVFKKQIIENDFIPNIDKLFKKVLDTATADEIRIKVTQQSGKMLEKLSQCHLANKYEDLFLTFFREVIRDKNIEVKLKALYNFPCLIQKFMKEDNQKYFEEIYQELMSDTTSSSLDIQRKLAQSIHETLKVIPNNSQLGYIGECLKQFMLSKDRDIRESISKNLDVIIQFYVKDKDYEKLMQNVLKSQTALQLGQSALSGGRDYSYKNSKAFQFQTEDLSNGGMRTGTGLKHNRKNIFKWDDDSSTIQNTNQTLDLNNYAVRLQEYLETDLTPIEYMKEFIYSQLLDDILILTRNILQDKGNWRQHEQVIINFAKQLKCFNVLEIYDIMGDQMIDLLKNGCDQVKISASFFISQMINSQYKSSSKQKLIDIICVKVFSVKSFKKHFLEPYLSMGEDKVAEVRIKFLYSAPLIRPYLENNDQSRNVMDLAHKIDQQLIKNKNSSIIIYSEAEDQAKLHYEQKLMEREKFEEDERKRRSETQEDSKFDYLTLLVNTTKKYGNMRRGGGGGGMVFKQSLNKKTISSAGIKQFSSPPVGGKADTLLQKQGKVSGLNLQQNGNISINIQMAPIQNQNSSQLSVTQQSQGHFTTYGQSLQSKRKASNIFTQQQDIINGKNQSGLLPPISQQMKEPIQNSNIAIRSVRKSELMLQQQINSKESQSQELQNSMSYQNQNHLHHQSGLINISKRSIQQKYSIQEGSLQQSPLLHSGAQTITIIPSEVQTILKRNQINVANGGLNSNTNFNFQQQSQQIPTNQSAHSQQYINQQNQQQSSSQFSITEGGKTLQIANPPFHHSNTGGSNGPYSNNYLNSISNGAGGPPITGSRESNKKRLNNEEFEKVLGQTGTINSGGSGRYSGGTSLPGGNSGGGGGTITINQNKLQRRVTGDSKTLTTISSNHATKSCNELLSNNIGIQPHQQQNISSQLTSVGSYNIQQNTMTTASTTPYRESSNPKFAGNTNANNDLNGLIKIEGFSSAADKNNNSNGYGGDPSPASSSMGYHNSYH